MLMESGIICEIELKDSIEKHYLEENLITMILK